MTKFSETNTRREPEKSELLMATILHRDQMQATMRTWLARVPAAQRIGIEADCFIILTAPTEEGTNAAQN